MLFLLNNKMGKNVLDRDKEKKGMMIKIKRKIRMMSSNQLNLNKNNQVEEGNEET